EKILVIGSGGAGKSTFSRRLGALLSIDVIHLDALYWQPGWIEPSKTEWTATIEPLLDRDTWVMDGNYSGTLPQRLLACDTVIFLDRHRLICLWRVVKRAPIHFGTVRPDMAAGCPEKLELPFLQWIWNYPTRSRPKILKLLAEHQHNKSVIRLQTNGQITNFFARLHRLKSNATDCPLHLSEAENRVL